LNGSIAVVAIHWHNLLTPDGLSRRMPEWAWISRTGFRFFNRWSADGHLAYFSSLISVNYPLISHLATHPSTEGLSDHDATGKNNGLQSGV
jgi:hypothetical protein